MKRPLYGPSIYYATDKNVFDALNQHKVTKAAIQTMLLRRNIIASRHTPRVDLAAYFSLLNHDYSDHQDIANRLGIVARRERTTSMSVSGGVTRDDIMAAVAFIKDQLEDEGDVVRVTKGTDRVTIHIQYSTVDYRRSEFTQTQHHKGKIEFIGPAEKCVVRCTHSDHVVRARDAMLDKLALVPNANLEKSPISLSNFPLPEDRSSFFNDLINGMDGFILYDVKEVYAFKARPNFSTDRQDENGSEDGDAFDEGGQQDDEDYDDEEVAGSHVERVNLRGVGVTRSNFLIDALEDDYYIVRVRWEAKRHTGLGQIYVIDALFADPATCSEFSFMLKGVFPVENGRLLTRQASPDFDDVDVVSRAIESKAQALIAVMRAKHDKGNADDADAI